MGGLLVASLVLLLANAATADDSVFDRCMVPDAQTTADVIATPPLVGVDPAKEAKNSPVKQCSMQATKGGVLNHMCWYNEKDDTGCCMSFASMDKKMFSLVNGIQPDGDFVGGAVNPTSGAPKCGPIKSGSWSKCRIKSWYVFRSFLRLYNFHPVVLSHLFFCIEDDRVPWLLPVSTGICITVSDSRGYDFLHMSKNDFTVQVPCLGVRTQQPPRCAKKRK